MCEEDRELAGLEDFEIGFSGEPAVVPMEFLEPILPPLRKQIKTLLKKTGKSPQRG